MTVSARRTRIRRLGRRLVRRTPLEAVAWVAGLLALAAMDPRGAHLVSLCPLDALGLSFCPGCGLGHAVAFLARGEWAASIRAHPLGGPAVLLLSARVVRLVRHARRVDTRLSSSHLTVPTPSCRTSSNTSPNSRATSSSTSPNS